ncbi:MAG: hypothetical protein JWM37_688 [Candidatus Saccharibacteria bacterium]|nr:hypothetical protein [Candidatus Saccharibacteria bacterium]
MTKNGILLHVYHLEAQGWERLVWGDPQADKLGTVTTFAKTLLMIPADEEVRSIVYSGPSQKDGLTEGQHTKKILVDRVDSLTDFPTLRTLIEKLTSEEYGVFVRRLNELTAGQVIKNTYDEIIHAAEYLNEGVPAAKVFQIASASHAPRCLHSQLMARQQGVIQGLQPWYVIGSDICFQGTDMRDVIVVEPPHRGDDPLVGFKPTLSEVLKPFFSLDSESQKQFLRSMRRDG